MKCVNDGVGARIASVGVQGQMPSISNLAAGAAIACPVARRGLRPHKRRQPDEAKGESGPDEEASHA